MGKSQVRNYYAILSPTTRPPYGCCVLGYHATTPEAFATGIHAALTLPVDEELALRRRAREWAVGRFSEREFEKGWQGCGWRTWL